MFTNREMEPPYLVSNFQEWEILEKKLSDSNDPYTYYFPGINQVQGTGMFCAMDKGRPGWFSILAFRGMVC